MYCETKRFSGKFLTPLLRELLPYQKLSATRKEPPRKAFLVCKKLSTTFLRYPTLWFSKNIEPKTWAAPITFRNIRDFQKCNKGAPTGVSLLWDKNFRHFLVTSFDGLPMRSRETNEQRWLWPDLSLFYFSPQFFQKENSQFSSALCFLYHGFTKVTQTLCSRFLRFSYYTYMRCHRR